MVTQQQYPILTLRLGGVEFTLIPTDRTGTASFLQHEDDIGQQRVSWTLENFTGILEAGPAVVDEQPTAMMKRGTIRAIGKNCGAPRKGQEPSRKDAPLDKKNEETATASKSKSSSSNAKVAKNKKQTSISFAPSTTNKNNERSHSALSTTGISNKAKTKKRNIVEETRMASSTAKEGKPPAAKKCRTTTSQPGASASSVACALSFAGNINAPAPEREETVPEELTQREEVVLSQPTLLGQTDGGGGGTSTSTGSVTGPPFLSQETNTNSSFLSIDPRGGGAILASGTEEEESTGSVARAETKNAKTTIQDIMDSAPSQATTMDERVAPTPAWTDDDEDDDKEERDEASNKAQPVRSPTPRVDGTATIMTAATTSSASDRAIMIAREKGTISTSKNPIEPTVNFDLPRVSFGPSSPPKGTTSEARTPTVDDGSSPAVAAMLQYPSAEPDEQHRSPPAAIPCPRWGHTLTSIGNRRLVLYGGQTLAATENTSNPSGGMALPTTLNDVMVYDTGGNTWFQPFNCQALPRQWHTSTYIPDRQLLIAFGGECAVPPKSGKSGPGKVKTSDTLTVLDTDLMLWYPPAVSGDVPPGRSGHTATLVGKTDLVVIGGVRGSKWLNGVCVLDVDRWNWSAPKVHGVPPKPRSYHTATAISDRRIVVFGGNDADASFNSVHVLQVTDEGDGEECAAAKDGTHRAGEGSGNDKSSSGGKYWRWTNPSCHGTLPSPRTGHTATLLDDRKTICVYGGWDPNADDDGITTSSSGDDDAHMFSSDSGCCYLLDTATWTWRKGGKVSHATNLPLGVHGADGGSRRAGHAAAALAGDNCVLVFGGRVPGDRFAGDFQSLSDF